MCLSWLVLNHNLEIMKEHFGFGHPTPIGFIPGFFASGNFDGYRSSCMWRQKPWPLLIRSIAHLPCRAQDLKVRCRVKRPELVHKTNNKDCQFIHKELIRG